MWFSYEIVENDIASNDISFSHRYIYKPFIGARSGFWVQLFGSTMCFSFVYLWHGTMPHVLIWAFLNYVGIVCESLTKAIWQTEFYQIIEVHTFRIYHY